MRRIFLASQRATRRLEASLDRRRRLCFILAAVAFLAAGFIRVWAAPLSAGPDVAQFWAFAKVFDANGLDFYRHADGIGSIFPEQAWGYVYPPVWILILRLALFASPGSLATGSFIDVGWRLAMKTPIIAADLAIGGLLLWAIPGSRPKKLLFATVWLFHPTAWYNSAVFGQFDAIAAAFLLASVILMVKGRDRLGFIFAGLAILTKQHTALPVLLMIAVLARQMPRRRLVSGCAIMAGMAMAVSLPFIVNGNLASYARAVFFPAQAPGYQLPLVYTFGGSGALVTYLHETLGWNIESVLYVNTPLLVTAVLVAVFLCYVKQIRVDQAALIGVLIFIALFYRINYQYLIIYIPLALLVLSRTVRRHEATLLAALVSLPALWIWLFDVSYWFWSTAPRNTWVSAFFKKIGLTNYASDWVYVAIALALMFLSLAYSAIVLARRHRSPPAVSHLAA